MFVQFAQQENTPSAKTALFVKLVSIMQFAKEEIKFWSIKDIGDFFQTQLQYSVVSTLQLVLEDFKKSIKLNCFQLIVKLDLKDIYVLSVLKLMENNTSEGQAIVVLSVSIFG